MAYLKLVSPVAVRSCRSRQSASQLATDLSKSLERDLHPLVTVSTQPLLHRFPCRRHPENAAHSPPLGPWASTHQPVGLAVVSYE